MAIFTYGVWFLIIFISDSTNGKRSDICSGNIKCVWLNELLERKGALPRLGLVVSHRQTHLYCYEGLDKMSVASLEKAWSGLEMSVFNQVDSSLSIAVANSSQSIESEVYIKQLVNSDNGRCTISLSPYRSICVSVNVMDPYVPSVDYALDVKTKVLLHLPVFMGIGLTLVWFAHSLSRSMAFYYGGGITVGVLAFIIILMYIFSKFIPKKNIIGLGIVAGGWTVLASVAYWFRDYALDIARDYWQYLTIYAVLAATVSFAVLYRMGPITHPRTFNLIQWSIQAVGFILIYLSTQMQELSLGLCGVTLLFYLIPIKYNPVTLLFLLLSWLLYCIFYPLIFCLRCFSFFNPFTWFRSLPKRRLLTKEEYEEQGDVETRKALSDLKTHCQNLSTRKAVDVMSRLKDSNRFAGFLNGRGHISVEEQVQHDWKYENDSDTDDSVEHGGSEWDYSPVSSRQSSSLGSSHYSQDDSPITHFPRHSPSIYRPSPSHPHSHTGFPRRH